MKKEEKDRSSVFMAFFCLLFVEELKKKKKKKDWGWRERENHQDTSFLGILSSLSFCFAWYFHTLRGKSFSLSWLSSSSSPLFALSLLHPLLH